LGTEPVASTIALRASISASPTLTLPPPVSEPEPSISSIPFFLNRPATPPVSVLITFSRRAMTFEKSTVEPLTSMPNSPASSTSDRMSATRRTALAGMHA
jgi:hypothetical protein